MSSSNQSNPYVGLRPFDVDESLLFFGRDDQTLELLQRLHNYSFVAVVGSSGSGKSSLLRAGLIPALNGGFLVNNNDKWKVAIMKPGQHPIYNMAAAILAEYQYDRGSVFSVAFAPDDQSLLMGSGDMIYHLKIIRLDQFLEETPIESLNAEQKKRFNLTD